jgi:peptide/nickel transport system permease protein
VRLPATIFLIVFAGILTMLIAIPIGTISGLRQGGVFDQAARVFFLVGYALPGFLIGILLILVFGVKIPIFPITGYGDSFTSHISHLFLPAITLALVYMAGYIRMTRAFVLETMTEDYIRTARAKGLTRRVVIGKHTLRAVLTPLVTLSGLDLAGLLGGAIITESVFNFNGVGKLSITAVQRFDLPLIVGIVLLLASFVIVANIIVDLLYAVIDPRVRLG